MARQLLHPGVLDEGLRSGLFLSGLRRTGKTTFLINDLVPALEAGGAIVIYVDLWSDIQRSPAALILAAVKRTLTELERPGSNALKHLKRVSGADLGALGFKFGFKLDSVGEPGGATLAQALAEVVDKAKTNVVLIVDEVQHAITSEEGNRMPYRARMSDLHGIEVLVPDLADRELVHQVIYDELCHGIVRDAARADYQRIVSSLQAQGAGGVVLGCTEIALLIGQDDVALPVFDSTALHAQAAVTLALQENKGD
ncbi:MAG: aspartate/glutamate racemase family protein [Cupriavidus necator]